MAAVVIMVVASSESINQLDSSTSYRQLYMPLMAHSSQIGAKYPT